MPLWSVTECLEAPNAAPPDVLRVVVLIGATARRTALDDAIELVTAAQVPTELHVVVTCLPSERLARWASIGDLLVSRALTESIADCLDDVQLRLFGLGTPWRLSVGSATEAEMFRLAGELQPTVMVTAVARWAVWRRARLRRFSRANPTVVLPVTHPRRWVH
jgi:hypothetical protein